MHFVVDNNMKLLGTITDRDIERHIKQKNKDTKMIKIMNKIRPIRTFK